MEANCIFPFPGALLIQRSPDTLWRNGYRDCGPKEQFLRAQASTGTETSVWYPNADWGGGCNRDRLPKGGWWGVLLFGGGRAPNREWICCKRLGPNMAEMDRVLGWAPISNNNNNNNNSGKQQAKGNRQQAGQNPKSWVRQSGWAPNSCVRPAGPQNCVKWCVYPYKRPRVYPYVCAST